MRRPVRKTLARIAQAAPLASARAIALAGGLLIPAAGLAYVAVNWLDVAPLSRTVFEVVGQAGSGPREYWCGAGDYAIAQLGVSATTPVYLWAAYGPSQSQPGRKAVQFALSVPPGGAAPPSYSLSIRNVGDSLTAAAARQYCYGNRFEEEIWRPGG